MRKMIDLAIMNVKDTTEELRAMGMKISPDTLRDGIEQGQFPFGNLIRKPSGSPVCYIYKKKFLEWAGQCGYEVGENGQRN